LEEEIDLRAYISVLLKFKYWIVGLAFASALVAMVVSLLQSPTYEAQAAIAIVQMRTDVTFTPEMVTLSEREDVKARRDALVALVNSSDVAVQTLDEVGDRLEPDERNVLGLVQMVEASSEGDLISIKVRHREPDVAALIANAWARSYERHVNALYGLAQELNTAISAQAEKAQETYNAAQAALETFVGDNRIATLEREIGTREALLETYQQARDAAQTQPVDLELSTRRQVLQDYYQDLQEIERWLSDLRALRAQAAKQSTSSAARVGNALALIFLHSRSLGGSGSLPVQLQIDLSEGQSGPTQVVQLPPLQVELQDDLSEGQSESVELGDVDALVEVLKARRTETQDQIDALTAALAMDISSEVTIEPDHPISVRIAALNTEILALQQQLEAERAQEQELRQARDLAWDTYQTLAKKHAEVGISSQVTGTEVRLATSAVLPEDPVSPRKSLNTVVAGTLGLLVGVFGAFAIEYWQQDQSDQAMNPPG